MFLTRLRRTSVLRVMTLWLLMLSASPFTAPFSTCDLGAFTGNAPIHVDLVAADKKIQDSATDLVSHAFTLVIVALVSPVRVAAGRVDPPQSPRLVLRI